MPRGGSGGRGGARGGARGGSRGGRGGGGGGRGGGRKPEGGAARKPQSGGFASGKNMNPKYANPNAPGGFDRKKYLADKIEQGVDVNIRKLQRNKLNRDTARFLDPLNKQAQNQGKKSEPTKTATDSMIEQAKAVSEQVRIKSVAAEKRKPYINKIMALLSGKFVQVALRPDASRIIQLCLKHGTDEQKDIIFKELSVAIPQLIVHEYSHFLIPKLLKYGSKDASKFIIDGLRGQVRNLIRKKFAAEVIEHIFEKRATAKQQSSLIVEFYGPEHAVFKESSTIEEILKANPGKKDAIIRFYSDAMISLFSTKTEGFMHYSIVHRLLVNFFNHTFPRQSIEMVELIREHIISILHTKDGARVVVRCFTLATPEQRKLMLGSMKEHILQICEDPYGYVVVLRALQVVDNASVTEKYILQYIGANLMTIITHEVAVNILFFILNESSSPYRNIRSYVVKLLEGEPKTQPSAENAKEQVPVCLKTPEVKRKEHFKYLYPQLLEVCINQLDHIARTLWGSRILFLVIKADIEGASELISAILGTIVGPEEYDPRINGGAAHPMIDYNFSRLLSQLICDPQMQEQGFAGSFYKLVSPYVYAWSMLPGASHVILDLLKTSKPEVRKEMITKLAKLAANDDVPGTKLILRYIADPDAPTKMSHKKRPADHDAESEVASERQNGKVAGSSASKARKTVEVEDSNVEEDDVHATAKPVKLNTPKSTPASKQKSQTPAAQKPQTPVVRTDASQSKSSTPAAEARKVGKHQPEEAASVAPSSAPKSTPAQQKRQLQASRSEPQEDSEEDLDLNAGVQAQGEGQRGVTFAPQVSDDDSGGDDDDVEEEAQPFNEEAQPAEDHVDDEDGQEDDEDEEEAPAPVKTPAKRTRKVAINMSPSTPARNLRSRVKVVAPESDDEEQDSPAPKATPARKSRTSSVRATPSARSRATPSAKATPGRRGRAPVEENEEMDENSPPKRARRNTEESGTTPARRGRKSLSSTTPGRTPSKYSLRKH